MKRNLFTVISICILFVNCTNASTPKKVKGYDFKENIDFASKQVGHQVKLIEESGKFLNPRTTYKNEIEYIKATDWTSGFFPGTMWLMYSLTNDTKWKDLGIKYNKEIESVKYLTSTHDLGFMIGCSFGTGYRLTQDPAYKDVLIEAAKSLSTRFKPTAGVIQSWDVTSSWQSRRGWLCPVIIDNMMNLELLFDATKLSGDSSFRKIAITHADQTMKHHFRSDFGTYHVVDYDPIKGGVRSKVTAQGYADESTWARGQAWALYGYAICYRETNDTKYLDLVDKIFQFIFTNKNLPNDLIPYWDFNAPNIPNEPRDASAAAITASALYELSKLGRPQYKKFADKIMDSLSGPAYRAILGTNGNFLLRHSVGSIPHGFEVDVPINYADYYFLEAMLKKMSFSKSQKIK